jgi:RNA polymerase sigma factor (sigma-70 family)
MKFLKPRVIEENVTMADAELVRAAQRGNKRAFVEIVARHQAMVSGIALGVIGDFAASEDVGQEVFLRAWRKIHDLREPEKLKGWLAQIARNAALAQVRSRKPHEELDESLAVADESPTPDEATASVEEAELVRQSLASLPEMYRLPLVLYYREGQSVRAVAESLGISEDATKQRLARGREMCRDRMSQVVEKVLKRTRPSAVFTMSIAAAIGALAAPSAIAGAAFASGTGVGASTAASWVKSIITTAMSTSKAFLATSALVALAFVPVGYHLQNATKIATPTRVSESETPVVKTNSALTFVDSALVAEWRALHEKYGGDAEAMPLLYKAIGEMTNSFHRQALNAALISEWAQVDPNGGLAFFMSKKGKNRERKGIFKEWLEHDAGTAVSALLKAGNGWKSVAHDCLKEIAKAAPERVAEIVSQLPKPEGYWDNTIRDAFASVAERGIEQARQAAENLSGPNRNQALAGVAQTWGKTDLNQVIAWAKALPDGADRDEIIRTALIGKASMDPAGALDEVGIVPSGGRQMYFASTTGARVLAEASKADFDGTVAWLVSHPGKLGREDLIGLAEVVTGKLNADAAGFLNGQAASGSLNVLLTAIGSALLNGSAGERSEVWDWLKAQPESEDVRLMREQVLHSAAWQDPMLAMKLMNDLPAAPNGDKQVEELAASLFNGGQRLNQFDQLLSEAPARLRTPLIESAFNLLRGDDLSEPHSWVNRLSLLPENQREHGTQMLAKAWAEQSPLDAIGWFNSLPQGDVQNNAAAAIVSGWAAKDVHGAADWVASIAPGAERDGAANALVRAAAQQYPREAWDWAVSIQDQATRERAASFAAQMMAARDLAMARQWIDSAPFSPDEKLRLEAALPKAGGK